MRDYRRIVAALERKANDAATSDAERDALLSKAAELRAKHDLTPPRRAPTVHGTGTWTGGGFTTTTTEATVSGQRVRFTFTTSVRIS